jgi:hypothetical protein
LKRIVDALHRLENGLLVGAFLFAVALPLSEALGRPLGGLHVPGTAVYVQQLTLWLAFLGGLLAARDGGHLTLSTAEFLREGTTARRLATGFAAAVGAAVTAVLAYGTVQVVLANRQQGNGCRSGPLCEQAAMPRRRPDRLAPGLAGRPAGQGSRRAAVAAAFGLDCRRAARRP